MEALSWIWWGLVKVLAIAWSLIWFLLGGWVSTAMQIVVIVAVIYGLKYGWRRAPAELAARSLTFGRFFWSWLRARDSTAAGTPTREVVRTVRVKEFGDVNVSSLLTALMLAGLAAASLLPGR